MRLLYSLSLFVTLSLFAANPEYPQMGPNIYNPTSDAATDIANALTQAKAEHKHVLLKFGANWCVWCHRLNDLLHKNQAVHAALTRDYILVPVDVNTRHGPKRNLSTIERYGNPTQHGLPVLVILDPNGNPLTTQETGALEEGAAHSPAKVIAFLQKWAPQR